jgi:hypothetical protein
MTATDYANADLALPDGHSNSINVNKTRSRLLSEPALPRFRSGLHFGRR